MYVQAFHIVYQTTQKFLSRKRRKVFVNSHHDENVSQSFDFLSTLHTSVRSVIDNKPIFVFVFFDVLEIFQDIIEEVCGVD